MQRELQPTPKESIISTMDTLTQIINEAINEMNQNIAEDLVVNFGFDYNEAIKVVTDFNDFELVDSENSDF